MKKLTSLILTICMLSALFAPLSVLPVSAATSGYYTYTVSGGEVTITDCNNSISGARAIPTTLGGYPVTSIGEYAFAYCERLTSVTIPNSVTIIGWGAFRDCTGLTSVTIGNSVTSIGDWAFSNCTGLTSVTIGNSVTSIGDEAFYGCALLSEINVSSSNSSYASVDGVLFSKDLKTLVCYPMGKTVASYVIPVSVTSIGDFAFEGCTGLTSVTIPDSVTSIGAGAFFGCTGLTSVTIPNSVTSIEGYAFEGCTGLTSVTIPDSVTSIGFRAFYGCTGLTSVTIGNSVTSIGNQAFSGCALLSEINVSSSNPSYASVDGVLFSKDQKTLVCYPGGKGDSYIIPNNVTSIGDCAFSGCERLTSVTIPNSVTSIGEDAFSGCTGLTSVTIPDSVTSIARWAFVGCNNFTIYGYAGSYAETYAFENDIPFKAIDLPQITVQPKSVTVEKNKTAKVTVDADGNGLTYKWYYKDKGSSAFKLTTSFKGNTYSVQMNADRSGRQVYCVITDKYGNTVQTDVVTLSMKARIATQPKSVQVAKGKTAKVTIKAEGEGLKYTWYYKDKGAKKYVKTNSFKGASYSVQMTAARSGRQVYCVVTDKFGNKVTSKVVTLAQKARIATQPKSVSVAKNKTAKITVKAEGEGLKYTWYIQNPGTNKFSKSSVKTSTYSVKMTSKVSGRKVYCKVTDKYGNTATSKTVSMKMK